MAVTQTTDTCTDNHATWSPILSNASKVTLTEGNMRGATSTSSGHVGLILSGFELPTAGKYYWEWVTNTVGTTPSLGWRTVENVNPNGHSSSGNNQAEFITGNDYNTGDGRILSSTINGSTSLSQAAYGNFLTVSGGNPLANGTVLGCAYDADNGLAWFSYNNSWIDGNGTDNSATVKGEIEAGTSGSQAFTTANGAVGEAGLFIMATVRSVSSGNFSLRTRSEQWTGDAPSGFTAVSTKNQAAAVSLTIENPDDHFKELIVDHDGSSTNFTIPWSTYNGSSGTYDTLFEIKRLADEKWYVIDSIRGLGKYFSWNTTTAQTDDTNVLSVSGATGTLGSTLADDNYLVRMHRLGAQASRDTSNSEGSITGGSHSLIISANATAGWSLCTYTGTGSNGTFGHGLSVAPEFIRFFNTANADGITVYHAFNPNTPKDHYGNFDSAPTTLTNDDNTKFNDTAPTPDVNSVGTANSTNKASDAMWCFSMHSVAGFSEIGNFKGNGITNGSIADLSLTPKSVILKNANGSATGDDWFLITDTRFLFNGDASTLSFNLTATEQATNLFDMLSNGIKQRTTNAAVNQDNDTMVYQIIGSPFSGSTPATANPVDTG